jgi:uncharacterized protein (DUF427 family)
VQSLLIAAARPHNQKGSTNMWEYRGQKRPPFAVAPKKGQESVWDYTRPPKIVADKRRVEVKVGDRVIADSQRTVRVLETASPPTFYIPPDDIRMDVLAPHPSSSWCEWKGTAKYWALNVKDRPREMIGWTYPKPTPEFESITGWFSFYPGRVECYVDGERVLPQPGEFYAGWITKEIVGPFKGEADSNDW